MSKRGSYIGGSTLVPRRWLGRSVPPNKDELRQIMEENEKIARSRGLAFGGAEFKNKHSKALQAKRQARKAEQKELRKRRAAEIAVEFEAEAEAHRKFREAHRKLRRKKRPL
jgi:hypothetical protein